MSDQTTPGIGSRDPEDGPYVCVYCQSNLHDVCSADRRAPEGRPYTCRDAVHGEETDR